MMHEGKTKPIKPKVLMYSSEYQNIEKLVLRKLDIETGGDLFGLWVDESTVVLQVITGPGRNCKRTEHSFFQDIDYLARTGSYLTQSEGLCNVGEWHSHHRLGLPKPSGGDQRTVWENLPKLALPRFVLLIANITENAGVPTVNLNAFLFIWGTNEMVKVEIVKLDGQSPFRSKDSVIQALEFGEEVQADNGDQKGFMVVNSSKKIKTVKVKEKNGGKETESEETKPLTKRQRKRIRNNNAKKLKKQGKVGDHVKSGDLVECAPSDDENVKLNRQEPNNNAQEVVNKTQDNKTQNNKTQDNKTQDNKTQDNKTQNNKTQDNKTQTKEQSGNSLSKMPKKKGKNKKNPPPTKDNPSSSCRPISIHASEILAFTSQLCKDLNDPRFTVDNDSMFEVNIQITPKNGSAVSLSVSKNSCKTNCYPEIRLVNNNGSVHVEQLSSWPVVNEDENRKTVENLRMTMGMVETAGRSSLWQSFTNIWETVQERLKPSNCVIL